MSNTQNTQDSKPSRLGQLTNTSRRAQVDQKYTKFVRWMRIVLPLSALAFFVVVVTWPEMENAITPIAKEDLVPESANIQNELLAPRFESTDDKKQPFTITAGRAVQGRDNAELIHLEFPVADLLMKDGSWVAAEAKKGTYEQQSEKLFLQDDVKLFYDKGYQLETDELRVDLTKRQAFSDKPVKAQGPEGHIDANGLEARSDDGALIFTGPAKLTLYDSADLSLGKALP